MLKVHPVLLLLGAYVTLVTGQVLSRQTCDVGKSQAILQAGADAIIGGIFSMHDEGTDGFGCGTVTSDIQAYEAVRWALELLNKKDQFLNGEFLNDTYVPGITIGMVVRDYCSRSEGAVYAAEEFYPRYGTDSRSCSQSPSGLTLGVIGASDSQASKDIAKLPFKIPMISFMASEPDLTLSNKYPSFMRTIPPNGKLMDVILETIKTFNWAYVSIVHTEDPRGLQSMEEMRTRLLSAGICLTATISTSPSDTSNKAIDSVLDRLLLTKTAGALYLGTSRVAYALLERSGSSDYYQPMGSVQWIFADSIKLSKRFENNRYPRGIISVVPTSRYIVEFEDHWKRIDERAPSPENPWFKEWFSEENQCSFPDVRNDRYPNIPCSSKVMTEEEKRAAFVQDRYVEPAVHAVFSYAVALRNAQRAVCTGTQANTPCSALRSMMTQTFLNDYLKKVDFTYTTAERVASLASEKYAPYLAPARVRFDDNGDLVNPSFDIMNLNDAPTGQDSPGFKFRRVGSWLNGQLFMNLQNVRMYNVNRTESLSPLPSSPCPPSGCQTCLGSTQPVRYFYKHGHVIITAVFSIHNAGDRLLSCGTFDLNARAGIQYLESLSYALQQITNRFKSLDQQFLRNVDLGGFAIDDCKSSIRSQDIISQVQRGTMKVMDAQGIELDPRTIDVYTAGHTSGLTIPVADLMNDLKRPILGYASGSHLLDNPRNYPYFLRMHPGLTKEMGALINVLKRFGWYFVQVIYVEGNSYSSSGFEVFRKMAAEHGICVVASHAFDKDIVSSLRSRPLVKPVVMVAHESHFRAYLQYITDANAAGEFVLLASSTFGRKKKVVEGFEDVADGTISVKWRNPNMNFFRSYLQGLRITDNIDNPWFLEWYENLFDCYVDQSNKYNKPGLCSNRNLPVTSAGDFELTEEATFLIDAVYAAAHGLHKTLLEFCGPNYDGICGNFTSSGSRGLRLLENIRASRFIIEGSTPPKEFSFLGNEGNIFVDVYNFQKNNSYVLVGEFNPETYGYTQVNGANILMYNGVSPFTYNPVCPGVCVECLYIFQGMKYQYIPGDIIIPAIFDIHKGGANQFSCSEMRVTNGFQYTEAFTYALQTINNQNLLDGVRLGGLLLDGCSSSGRAMALVNNMYSGALMLQDQNMMNIDLSKFLSWMTYESKSTIDIADILAAIQVPIVSPAATAPLLHDKGRFSTFFRTVKSDTHVAAAMAKLTKELGFDYVITLNAPDFSSRQARDEFRRLAQDEGVCLLATYEFVTDGNMDIIMNSINESTTQVVIVFAEPDQYVADLIHAKNRLYDNKNNITFIANRRWNLPENIRKTIENSLTFNFGMFDLASFDTYLASKRPTRNNPNPWFREYYEERYRCNLPGSFRFGQDCGSVYRSVTEGDYVQDLWVLSTINAVYSIAEGVKATLDEKCKGVPGVCPQFQNSNDTYQRIMANMDAMSFTDMANDVFEFVEREANRGYTIQQFIVDGNQREIGTYNTDLSLTDQAALNVYQKVRSRCDDLCLVCKRSGTNFDDFTYTRGDLTFYFVGLFDVHRQGTTPFTCGDINHKHGFELLEAFNFAVDYVNSKKGMFANLLADIRIDAVGLDTCQSPTRAANLVANIHSGNINLERNGVSINPRNFDVYIGPFDTESSLRVADVLNVLNVPQISYGATSLELQDPRRYRYFLRTVPADDKQARAIISYLKRFKINNVQIISTFDSVGEKGKEEFLRLAKLNSICVAQEITVGKNGPVLLAEAKDALRKVANRTDATVVILFVDDPRPILQPADNDDDIQQKYFFIGTDKWGMDLDVLAGLGPVIRNKKAVTFDIETADIPDFDIYLESLDRYNYTKDNPWFKDFYEEVHNCYIDTDTNEYTRKCTAKDLGIPRSPGYIQDPYVLYVVNAVFSAALGLHHALTEVCEPDYTYACNLFINDGERRQRIYRNIKSKARFEDATRQPFYFTPTGESDRGYHIYYPIPNPSPAPGQPTYVYKNVGSYNDTHFLKIDITYEIEEDSTCPGCQCGLDPQPSRYMEKPNTYNLNLVYVGDIHQPDPIEMERCGAINTDRRFQNLMAFFYAIEMVNNNTNRRFPISLQFGGVALDTCNQPYKLGQDMYSLLSGEGLCGAEEEGQVIPPSTVVAFIADTTDTALPVSSMLSPRKILTISPSATSVELSDKRYHPYFLRTVPPDNIQANVMLSIMKAFNWDYATVVYSKQPYGIAAKNALLEQANMKGSTACISAIEGLDVDDTLAEAERIIDDLSQQVGSRVIILFTTPEHSRLLLQATKSKGLTGKFIWLASEAWANSPYIVEGYEEQARGAVTIQIRSEIVREFIKYMTSLTLTDRKGIPDDWFEDLYQTLHQCRLLSARVEKDYSIICTGDERITEDMLPQDPFVLHTIISVYIVAQGLNNLELCRNQQLEISACLDLQEERRRDIIYNGVLDAQWNVLPVQLGDDAFSFSFTDEGYGDVGFNILNYHRDINMEQFVYTKIGSYSDSLTIDRTKYNGGGILARGILPVSQCPAGIRCSCLDTDGNNTHAYVRQTTSASSYNSANFILGDDGRYYNSLTGQLVEISKVPSVTGRFTDIWAIIVATIAGIGAFVALCMFVYLLVVYPNRGGTSILGYTLSFGVILLYGLVFAFIAHANEEICGLRRFGLGFVYALCYGALFVKLLDCWRNQDKEDADTVKYNKLGRPCGLFMVVVLLVLVQVIINAEWLILQPPEYVRVLYKNQLWPRCAPDDFSDESLVLSLVYVMVLILLSVIFGFVTFRKSKNHYESRWILGIACLSIPCWVVWCLVATIGVYKVRDAAVAIGLLVNATFMLLCGPLRKLYLLNKYQALVEEEEREYKEALASSRGPDYASTYGRQYDNVGRLHEGSVRGSAYGGTYPSQRYAPSSNMGTQRSSGSGHNPYADPAVQREETQIQ